MHDTCMCVCVFVCVNVYIFGLLFAMLHTSTPLKRHSGPRNAATGSTVLHTYKSKTDSTHSRRTVFSYLKSKEAVSELFRDIAPKIADRPGGYTRIIKTGFRLGDAAEMCMMELVDFNELLLADSASRKAKTTRRSRSSSKKAVSSVAPAAPLMGQANVEEETAAVLVSEASVEEAPVDAAPMDAAPMDAAPMDESPIEASVAAEESSLEVNTDEAVAESTSSEISESEEGKAADEESKEA